MTQVPYPPVPQRLREMLKDYPELIERLQAALNQVVEKPAKGTLPFEVAAWALEDSLSAFISEARGELEEPEASRDTAAIEFARAKGRLISDAGSRGNWITDEGLGNYFQAEKEASKRKESANKIIVAMATFLPISWSGCF